MAGSEKTGWENGSAALFERRTCFVTPLPETDATAVETVVRFWRGVGGEPVTVSPDEHDEIVAYISHLPQVIASSLCSLLAQKNPSWRNHAGGGLRDTTRIAGSNAEPAASLTLDLEPDKVLPLRLYVRTDPSLLPSPHASFRMIAESTDGAVRAETGAKFEAPED